MGHPGRRFAVRLAARLGCPNVDAMLREMSAPQLAEWAAFYSLEPWGFEEENRQVGTICSTVANMAGRKMRDGVTSLPDHFIPRERRPATPEELVAKLKSALGGG